MIAFDANVLYASLVRVEDTYEKARRLMHELSKRDDVVIAEQTLVETYGLLRNPIITKPPMTGLEAVNTLDRLRTNPHWKVVDVPSDTSVMRRVWRLASGKGFARRRIHDLRLAETLRYWKVDTFYTRNVRDFEDVGFEKLINPFEE